MALSPEEIAAGKRVSIQEAQELQKTGKYFIIWRPDETLPEEKQYAIFIE